MTLETGHHEERKDVFKPEYGAWSYAVRGKTVDDRELRVVISFEGDVLLLITAIDLSKER